VSKVLRQSTKSTATFVVLSWGFPDNPTFLRLWDGTSDLRYLQNTYLSVPSLEIELGEQIATIDEEPTLLRLPRKFGIAALDDLTDALASGRPFPRIRCSIFESVEQGKPVYLAAGTVQTSDSSSFGAQAAALELEIYPPFDGLDTSAGLLTLVTCVNPYLGTGCYKEWTTATGANQPLAPLAARAAVQFTSISGLKVSVEPDFGTGLPASWIEQQPTDWWKLGSFEADGLAIPIASWEEGTLDFVLENWPPYNWGIGNRSVWLYPGCDKSPQACFERDNLGSFNAYGAGTPAVNPVLDVDDRS
jgi:hypothetical protein